MSDKRSNLGELIMRTWSVNDAAVAVLFGLMWVVVSAAARADVKDYEFQLVQSEMKKGDGAIVAVRLVNKKSGKPVPDAVIFAKWIDMAPDAMQEMTAPLEQLPSTEPGVYRFKTDLMMQGRWQLSLGAKVQGEEGTVAAQLVLKALP
jgi:YtkA-like